MNFNIRRYPLTCDKASRLKEAVVHFRSSLSPSIFSISSLPHCISHLIVLFASSEKQGNSWSEFPTRRSTPNTHQGEICFQENPSSDLFGNCLLPAHLSEPRTKMMCVWGWAINVWTKNVLRGFWNVANDYKYKILCHFCRHNTKQSQSVPSLALQVPYIYYSSKFAR